MATKNMFEQLLEHIVNGEEAKADALFHNIIVSKSREIYENIIESDLEDEEMDEATESDDEEEMDEATESDDEEMDEATEEDDEEMDENFGIGDEAVGGDATDDMMHAIIDGDCDDYLVKPFEPAHLLHMLVKYGFRQA